MPDVPAPISLLSKLADVPVAFIDVETTGASPEYGDRVIELGIARVVGGEVTDRYQQLIDPRRTIGPGITALTGISSEMVEGMPVFADVVRDALAMMRGAVVAGHNVPFDLGFLRNEFRRAGVELPAALPGAHVIDTVRIARKLFGRGGNGLQALATKFGVRDDTAHRALADALTTARVFHKMLEPLGGHAVPLVDVIQLQGGVLRLEGKSGGGSGGGGLPLELEEALDRGQPVEMEYVDARESRTVRVITPVEVRRFRGEMILVAWCAMRNDRRTFKLDRIVRLTKIDPDTQLPSTNTPNAP